MAEDAVHIFILVECELDGSPDDLGLSHLPEDFRAEDVIECMRADGSKLSVLTDWSIIDNPLIKVQVSRQVMRDGKPVAGRYVNSHAEW